MTTHIFLLCFNESVLLPETIQHYKRYLPKCIITIYDNNSTDNSVEIAKSMGCNVIPFGSKNKQDEHVLKDIKNNCWKDIKDGWVIMADMDEWLCVSEEDLKKEELAGTTVLQVRGLDMIGESRKKELKDIDLHSIRRAVDNKRESKNLCFLRNKIEEMSYNHGAHNCKPKGIVQFSVRIYINKHMNNLGVKFLINKMVQRYKRSHEMRKQGMDTHYTYDKKKILEQYNNLFKKSLIMPDIF